MLTATHAHERLLAIQQQLVRAGQTCQMLQENFLLTQQEILRLQGEERCLQALLAEDVPEADDHEDDYAVYSPT